MNLESLQSQPEKSVEELMSEVESGEKDEKGLMTRLSEIAKGYLGRATLALALVLAAENAAEAKDVAKENGMEFMEKVEKEAGEVNVKYALTDKITENDVKVRAMRLEVRDTKGTENVQDDWIGDCVIVTAEKGEVSKYVKDCKDRGNPSKRFMTSDKVTEITSEMSELDGFSFESALKRIDSSWSYFEAMKIAGKENTPEGKQLKEDLKEFIKDYQKTYGNHPLDKSLVDDIMKK